MMKLETMKLVCPDCQRENDPKRIYCHDCGTKLDRAGIISHKLKQEDPKAVQKRVAAMFDPGHALLRKRIVQGGKLVLGAAILAVVVQMLRPPDVPEKTKASEMPPQINLQLEDAAMNPRSAPLQYTDDQINTYLAYTLKGKRAALSKYLQFERAIASFDEGYSQVTVERSLYGVSLFTTASYAASIENGKIVTTNRGAQIGRMPIHPALMQYGGILFDDVRAALERERKSIVKLGSMEFHPHLVVFTPKAASPPPQT